jgi:hypothetical protein
MSKKCGCTKPVPTRPLQSPVPGELVVVGDLHGDPLALLRVLQLSGAVEAGDPGWEAMATAIQRGTVDRSILDGLQWKEDAQTTLLLLGDLVDNKRHGSALPVGSEELLLETLHRLRSQGQKQGSDVRWVLGNHDMENTLEKSRGFCTRYAHPDYCDAEGGFTPARRAWMREWIGRMDAKPVVVIDGLAFAHGSLSSEFLDRYDERDPDELLARIAHDYRESAASGQRVDRIATSAIVPDWCRQACEHCTPATVDQEALRRLGCYASFGGHTPTGTGRVMMRTAGGAWQEAPQDPGTVETGAAYFLDLGMSRGFRQPGETRATFGCAILRPLATATSPSWSIECRYSSAPPLPGARPTGTSRCTASAVRRSRTALG